LTRAIITLASQYGRYGYRRITALLRGAGWPVGKDRVERIWRREGLKVPQKQKPRGRLWLNDGSCVRLRPERANQVWSYDFVSAMTHDGRALRLLTLIDEYTRECLAIRVARRLGSQEVIETLADCWCGEFQSTFAQTMAPNSWPASCGSGWGGWARERCTLNPGAPGRTGTAKASTASCETNA
jgi:transposase InsO family protein